jgi:hypothetical protein
VGAVRLEVQLGASVDEVWKVVGDFAGMVEALGLPVEVEGAGSGALRKVTVDGAFIRQLMGDAVGDLNGEFVLAERLEERDETAKRLSYSMPLAGPMPLSNYFSTMELAAAGDGRCELTWTAKFDAVGVTDDVATAAVRNTYDFAVSVLKDRYGA